MEMRMGNEYKRGLRVMDQNRSQPLTDDLDELTVFVGARARLIRPKTYQDSLGDQFNKNLHNTTGAIWPLLMLKPLAELNSQIQKFTRLVKSYLVLQAVWLLADTTCF
jgi:hypothetical protein